MSIYQKGAIASGILCAFVLIALRIAWFPPAPDEALVAVPAWNLAHHGFAGTTTLADPTIPWKDIQHRTYNILPGGILYLAAGYSVLPATILATRILMSLWGAVLIGATFQFLRLLTEDGRIATFGTLLLLLDYHFMIQTAYARVEMMTAALGTGALAWYCGARQVSLARALFGGSLLVTLACLTHPQGFLYAAALLILAVSKDGRGLTPRHGAVAAVPILVCGALWLLYVSRDPAEAIRQLSVNAGGQGRMAKSMNPFFAVRRELYRRYLSSAGVGFSGSFDETSVAKWLLLAVPMGSLVLIAARGPLRRQPGVKILLTITVVLLAMEIFIENSKAHFYLIHMAVFYCASMAVVFRDFLQRGRGAVVVAALWIALNVVPVVARVRADFSESGYRPAVAFLSRTLRPGELVMGPSELWFDCCSTGHNLKEDPGFGAKSGLNPDYIVDRIPYKNPGPGEFRLIYDFAGYRIYRRK
jgi:hypothetical protein